MVIFEREMDCQSILKHTIPIPKLGNFLTPFTGDDLERRSQCSASRASRLPDLEELTTNLLREGKWISFCMHRRRKLTENGCELWTNIIQDGPNDYRSKIEGKDANIPQDCQLAFLRCAQGIQALRANICKRGSIILSSFQDPLVVTSGKMAFVNVDACEIRKETLPGYMTFKLEHRLEGLSHLCARPVMSSHKDQV